MGTVWIDEVESFYCHLEECESDAEFTSDQNSTYYKCPKVECSCITDRMLCGADGSVDLTDFLKEKLSLFGWLGCSLCIVSAVISLLQRLCREDGSNTGSQAVYALRNALLRKL